MKIKEKLETLRHYYSVNPKKGHTELMKNGTKNTENKLILSYRKKDHTYLECKPSEVISWDNINLSGFDKPLVIDNGAMLMLLNECLAKITLLEFLNK